MTIAALVLFGGLLLAWLLVPAERRQRQSEVPQRITELPAEAAA
ncbi:MAG TPA: hypothetical protein VHU77_02485 [Candidatus Limnocylindria bacterium]|jgi:hypothetical protein|nr:hypothetical protein [Candidatus Limnocylindria bacterium]